MKNYFSHAISRRALVAVVVLQFIPAFASVPHRSPADGNAGNPGVVPLQSRVQGKTYGEWSAAFWQWEFSLPVTNHPLFQDGAEDCSAGQTGSVWFIGGTFSTTPGPPGVTLGQANRSCSIPAGTFLFFPVVNAECSSVSGDNSGDTSEAGLRECAASFANLTNLSPDKLRAAIDGVPVQRLSDFRVSSPLFALGPLPSDNIFQFFGLDAPTGSTWRSVSDGIHLMLSPLPVGPHTIHFEGEIDFPDGSQFIEDITYHLNVTPRR